MRRILQVSLSQKFLEIKFRGKSASICLPRLQYKSGKTFWKCNWDWNLQIKLNMILFSSSNQGTLKCRQILQCTQTQDLKIMIMTMTNTNTQIQIQYLICADFNATCIDLNISDNCMLLTGYMALYKVSILIFSSIIGILRWWWCVFPWRARKCKSQLDSLSLPTNLQKNLLFLPHYPNHQHLPHHIFHRAGLFWYLNVLPWPRFAECWGHFQHWGKIIITIIT